MKLMSSPAMKPSGVTKLWALMPNASRSACG